MLLVKFLIINFFGCTICNMVYSDEFFTLCSSWHMGANFLPKLAWVNAL